MNYKTRKVTDYFPRRQERESRRFGKQKSRTTIRLKGQDKTGQDRTGQDRTGQDRTGQDRTAQDRTARDTRSTDPANTVETRSLRSRSLSSISADPGIAPDRRIERTTRSEHWKANPFRKASGSSYPRRDSGLRSPDAGPDARYNPCRCFCECTTRPRARHDPPDNRYAGNNIPGCNCRPAPPSDRPLNAVYRRRRNSPAARRTERRRRAPFPHTPRAERGPLRRPPGRNRRPSRSKRSGSPPTTADTPQHAGFRRPCRHNPDGR